MILDQLAERERQRAAAEEARRKDGEEMKRRIQALKDEENRVSRAPMEARYAGPVDVLVTQYLLPCIYRCRLNLAAPQELSCVC